MAIKSLNSHGRQLLEVKQTCLIQESTLEFPHNNNLRNIATFFQDRSKADGVKHALYFEYPPNSKRGAPPMQTLLCEQVIPQVTHSDI